MTNVSQEVVGAANPAYFFLIDMDAVDAIVTCAQQIEDVDLGQHQESLRVVHERIKCKASDARSATQDMSQKALRSLWQALGSQKLIDHSAEVMTDVVDFAACTQSLFEEVKSHRALTPKEKAVGQRFVTILKGLKELLPTTDTPE